MSGGENLDTALVLRLIETLEKEKNIYESILKLSIDKKDVIVSGKVSELEGMTRLEQSVILKLGKLEEEREELIGELSAVLKTSPSEITLSSIANKVPEDLGSRLKGCQESLLKTVSDIRNSNTLNSKLIRNSLDYIDFSINILTNAGASGNSYSNSGQSSDPKKRNFFDIKL